MKRIADICVPAHVYKEIMLNDFESRHYIWATLDDVLVYCNDKFTDDEYFDIFKPDRTWHRPNAFRYKSYRNRVKRNIFSSGYYPIHTLPWNRNKRPKKK